MASTLLQELLVPQSSLAALTFAEVLQQEWGSSLSVDHQEAIRALLEAFEAGLTGKLSPHYHLSSIDPGIGKTQSVSAFLRTWKSQGFNPPSSVLIGLSRLQEIDSYLKDAGLEQQDIAILTSDPERNALGLAKVDHGYARVMFTTQQMIERRTRDRTFAEVEEFHFEGAPRALRIWDESLIPARPLVLKADEIGKLPHAFRRKAPKQAKAAQALTMQLWNAEKGEQVLITEEFQELPEGIRRSPDDAVASTLEALSALAGQRLEAVPSGDGVHLAGASRPLPSDFAPVVILDASARVRSTYKVWEASGGPLRRLPEATNDYSRLRVHLWERRVGKTVVDATGDVAEALAQLIQDDGTDDHWLIVTYKDQPIHPMLPTDLKALLEGRVHFLTWGMHHGTNAFSHCRNVVLIGQLSYAASDYRALAAACGAVDPKKPLEEDLRRGEYQHNLLQALTRASVRRSRGGRAGVCTAYVVASPNLGFADLIPETFPGCIMDRWSPDQSALEGRVGELIGLLADARRRRVPVVSKKELREALSMKGPNLSRLLRHSDVQVWFENNHVRVHRNALELPPGFDPYPGHGFTIDSLDDCSE